MNLRTRFGGVSTNAPCDWSEAGLASPGGTGQPFNIATVDRLSGAERATFLDGWMRAQEFERLRLGRELHDSTGQLLLALRLNIAQLRVLDADSGRDGMLREIEEAASQIESQIRVFSFLHYPIELEGEGLSAALRAFVQGFGRRTGLKTSFVNRCTVTLRNGPAALALLRIAQEALTNVYRHASAIAVAVKLQQSTDQVELIVRDNGAGFPPDGCKLTGVGLQGMRHRAELQGGRLSVRQLKRGTQVKAQIPLSRFMQLG